MNKVIINCTFIFLVYGFTTCIAKYERDYGIIDGYPIDIVNVPFVATFRLKGRIWGCGASIIHEQFLITAAQCVGSTKEVEVLVGTRRLCPGCGEVYEVESQFRHPNYNRKSYDYDIAVLKLKKKIQFNEKVKIIEMADSTVEVKKGDRLDTMGFGMVNATIIGDLLLGVDLAFVDHDECAKIYSENHTITERMICAGRNRRGPYFGDVGGALIIHDLLIGVVSWRDLMTPHGDPLKPSVFSYLPSMREFIDKTIQENL